MVYLSYTNLIRYTYIYIYIYLQYILYTLDLPLTQDAIETNEGLGVGISDPKIGSRPGGDWNPVCGVDPIYTYMHHKPNQHMYI